MGQKIILCGDFNAHLGALELTNSGKRFVGPNVFHEYSNENGESLLNLVHFGQDSWQKTKTLKVTWTNGTHLSQIDHVLCNSDLIWFNHMFGEWVPHIRTDHKLISMEVSILHDDVNGPVKRKNDEALTFNKRVAITKIVDELPKLSEPNWNIDFLQVESFRTAYCASLKTALTNVLDFDRAYLSQATAATIWHKLQQLIIQAANSEIPARKIPLTPRRLKAVNDYKGTKRLLGKKRTHYAKRHFELMKSKMRLANQQHVEGECRRLLDNVSKVHVRNRLSMVYKFARKFSRKLRNKVKPAITLLQWEDELRKYCREKPPGLIPEIDYCPLGPPPTTQQIREILLRMRNGTSPGQDRLNIEMFKCGPDELIEMLQLTLSRAWLTNVIPSEWLQTTQIPVPKVPSPNSTDDFRRISISNVIYKIYAAFLLQQLERYVEEIPLYQAGFLRERSTDDHIFTLRRILEERWRKGIPTYVMSIDLRKAFDMLDMKVISAILSQCGVPCHLVNRIIQAVLYERTAVQWQGQRTQRFMKGRGVKQGCSISPYIFVVVLHHAINRACIGLDIDLSMLNIKMPLILAYADDIIILSDNIPQLEAVFRALTVELRTIGLEVNDHKCSLLIREPCAESKEEVVTDVEDMDETVSDSGDADEIVLDGKTIKIVQTMKYLGIYISSDLDRRSTVSHRVKLAYEAFHMLNSFLQTNKLPFELLTQLYHSTIVPIVLYGIKVATLTKRNRASIQYGTATGW